MRTEQEVLKDFEKLGYDVHIKSCTIRFKSLDDEETFYIDKTSRTYETNTSHYIGVDEHKLIHELFEIWGWLDLHCDTDELGENTSGFEINDDGVLIAYFGNDSHVVIPNNVFSIKDYAFVGDKGLTAVEIPNTVKSIGNGAFLGCTSLSSILIPNSVENMGYGVFAECDSLTVYCEANSQPKGWNNFWNHNNRPVYWNYKNQKKYHTVSELRNANFESVNSLQGSKK